MFSTKSKRSVLTGLTVARTTLGITWVVVIGLAARNPVDPDVWWHIRSGLVQLREGVLRTDVFSYTALGDAWVNHSWASQPLLALLWQQLADAGLVLWTVGWAGLGLALVWSLLDGNTYVRCAVLLLGTLASVTYWTPRPQMVSFAFAAVTLWVLVRWREGTGPSIWWLVPLFALWGNLHGGWVVGYVVLGCFAVGEGIGLLAGDGRVEGRRRVAHVAAAGAAAGLALVANPFGWRVWLVPFETFQLQVLRDVVQEWSPPSLADSATWPFFALLVMTAASLGRRPLRVLVWQIVLLAVTTVLSLTAVRHIGIFVVAALPVLCAQVAAGRRSPRLAIARAVTPAQGLLNGSLLAVVVVLVVARVGWGFAPQVAEAARADVLPVAAAAFIERSQPPGPLYNSYNFGGYLILELPGYPVFADGRTDLYGDDFLGPHFRANAGDPVWRELFARWDIRLALIETDSGLAEVLRSEPGWTLTYEDDLASVFQR